MGIVAVDSTLLHEPNLLRPYTAPTRLWGIRSEFANARLIYCPQIGGTKNLAPTLGIVGGSPSGHIMPVTGTLRTVATPGGLAHTMNTTGDYILSGLGPNTGEHLSTSLIVFTGKDFTTTARPFATRRNTTSPSYYAGFYVNTGSENTMNYHYGDSTGGGPTDRRSLSSPNDAVPKSGIVSVAGRFLTSTTGQMWINGIEQTLTASGTGGAINGVGNIQIHDFQGQTATEWLDILLLVLFNTALPGSLEQSLSINPFQIFEPM